jgi:DNA-binding GntR family transcriptional regulator
MSDLAPEGPRDPTKEHTEFMDAALNRNPAVAIKAMETHYRRTANQVIGALDQMTHEASIGSA